MNDAAWRDDPVESREQDTLDRRSYAKRAAGLIHDTHTFSSSVVFGLSGPWGSGKSSLINMIVEDLLETNPDWVIARFTPWATSDLTGLVEEFYSSLTQTLPQKGAKRVRRALGVLARVAAPAVTLIPLAGASAAEASKIASDALTAAPSWQEAFNEAAKELAKLGKRVLVVVDDIDRLHSDELMMLLKVVRLLGRFPGVQYLLAYDDETLLRNLSSGVGIATGDGSAERYMEKIVQYPLLVPPLLHFQKLSRIRDGLAEFVRSAEHGEGKDRLSALESCFLDLLHTPRAIDRYLAQLRHHLPMLEPGEIDDVDVQLLTLLRVSFPQVFYALPAYRQQLIDGHTGDLKRDSKTIEFEKFDTAELIDRIPIQNRSTVRQILTSLFPNTRADGQYGVYGSTTGRGVSTDEYFDRYFAMNIPRNDISDETVRRAVRSACHGDGLALVELLKTEKLERQSLVLMKASSATNEPQDDAERVNLATVLAGFIDSLPDEFASPFGSQERALWWLANLLTGLKVESPVETATSILAELPSLVLRVRAWGKVQSALEGVVLGESMKWIEDVSTSLADSAAEQFLRHLRMGDAAPAEVGVGYELHFAIRNGQRERLRVGIKELVSKGELNISILASRLVSARTFSGLKSDWVLSSDFDQQLFDALAPSDDDPWYASGVIDVDVRDLSWENRRKFASGRVSRPRSATE